MLNPIKEIVKFNKEAGLIEKGYDDFLESSFQIEEALEGFPNVLLKSHMTGGDAKPETPKDLARCIVGMATTPNMNKLADVDRFDKACDAVVFAVGSMAKLGLDVHQITKGLNAVMKANNAKLKMPKDEFGKLMKPEGFVGPEAELQKILDERN